jgi:hypothetical protein
MVRTFPCCESDYVTAEPASGHSVSAPRWPHTGDGHCHRTMQSLDTALTDHDFPSRHTKSKCLFAVTLDQKWNSWAPEI